MKIDSSRQTWTEHTNERTLAFLELRVGAKNIAIYLIECSVIMASTLANLKKTADNHSFQVTITPSHGMQHNLYPPQMKWAGKLFSGFCEILMSQINPIRNRGWVTSSEMLTSYAGYDNVSIPHLVWWTEFVLMPLFFALRLVIFRPLVTSSTCMAISFSPLSFSIRNLHFIRSRICSPTWWLVCPSRP